MATELTLKEIKRRYQDLELWANGYCARLEIKLRTETQWPRIHCFVMDQFQEEFAEEHISRDQKYVFVSLRIGISLKDQDVSVVNHVKTEIRAIKESFQILNENFHQANDVIDLDSPERKQVKSNWDVAVLASAIYQYQEKYKVEFENFTEKVRRYSSPRQMPELDMTMKLSLHGNSYQLEVLAVGGSIYHVRVNDQLIVVSYESWGNEIIVQTGERKYQMQIVQRANALQCELEGIPYMLPFDTGGMITAPSPSVVLTVDTYEGQKIKKGELLLTLEAMKMEMAVTAPEDGTIMKINVKAGEQVSAGQALVDFETVSQTQGKEEGDKSKAEAIDFSSLAAHQKSQTAIAIRKQWDVLERNYYSAFTGFEFHHVHVMTIVEQLEFEVL